MKKTLLTIMALCLVLVVYSQEQQDSITYDYRSIQSFSLFHDSTSTELQRLENEFASSQAPPSYDPATLSQPQKDRMVQVADSLRNLQSSAGGSASARTAGGSGSGSTATAGESGTAETIVALPSPSSLGKVNMGAEMVNLYTGDLSYTIPLYTLESRDLTVPIALSYNSASNKVDNIPSEVGMGWSINAGGLIARVMKGLPDEFQGDISQANGTKYTGYGWLKLKNRSIGGKSVRITDPEDFKSRWPDIQHRKNIIENSALGGDVTNLYTKTEGWDTEPDEFFYNFGDYSGKFVFTQDGDIHTVPYQEFQIEKTTATVNGSEKIIGFSVLTPQGMTYTFGSSDPTDLEATEISQMSSYSNAVIYDYLWGENWCLAIDPVYGNCVDAIALYEHIPFINWTFNAAGEWILNNDNRSATSYPEFSSTWYLKKIESQNDQVTFNYDDEGEISYFQGKSASVKMPNLPRYTLVDGANNPIGVASFSYEAPVSSTQNRLVHPELSYHTRSYQYITLQSKRLKSIATSTGATAEFDSYGLRKDLVGSTRLRKVRINQGSEEVLAFRFDQSYMVSPEEYYAIWEGADFLYLEDELIRILVQTFKPDFADSDMAKLLDAEHHRLRLDRVVEIRNRTHDLPATEFTYNELTLPRRFSADQDKWGYYNHNPANILIPPMSYRHIFEGTTENQDLITWERTKFNSTTTVQELVDKFIAKYNCASNDCARRGGNRNANSTRMKAGLLTQIDHPLGGSTTFEYVHRRAAYNGSNPTIGGAKISKVTYLPNDAANKTVTNFSFGDGRAPNVIGLGYSLKSSSFASDEIHRSFTFSSHPVTSSFLTHGSGGGFGQVTVLQEGKGKTVYEFVTPLDKPNKKATIQEYNLGNQSGNNQYPFAPEDNDWMRGKVDKVSFFKEGSAEPFMVKDHEYELSESNLLWGLKPGFYGYRTLWPNSLPTLQVDGSFPAFEAAFYSYNSAVYRVKTTVELLAGDRDASIYGTKTINYDFVQGHPNYPKSVTTTYQDGSEDKVETKYLFEYFPDGLEIPVLASYSAEGLWDLKSSGMVSTPIEVISQRRDDQAGNWYVTGGEINIFQRGSRFSSNSNSSEVYLREKRALVLIEELPLASFQSSVLNENGTQLTVDSRYKTMTSYNDYNSQGRILITSSRSGLSTKATWTHYNSLIASVTSNSTGSNPMKTTYAYTPLVGITQYKDINNRATNYYYDNYNRLYLRKDHNGHIIDRIRYNYRNGEQPTLSGGISINGGVNKTCENVKFTANVYGDDIFGEMRYEWNFGDSENTSTCPLGGGSSTATGKSVFHRFSEPGTYTVTLTIKSPEAGTSITRTANISIFDEMASLKIYGSSSVEYCSDGSIEQMDPIIAPPDGPNPEGEIPVAWFSLGWDTNGARCYTPGERSAKLQYKNSVGTWVTFSNERYGELPAEAYSYSPMAYTIEIRAELQDYCSTITHTAARGLTVNPCSQSGGGTGGGGSGGGGGGPIDPPNGEEQIQGGN